MKILIIRQRGIPVSLPELELTITINTTPPGNGIAVFEMGKVIDWSWPEYVITVGEVDIGRHERDAHIEAAGDVNAQLRQILDSLLQDYIEDDDEGDTA